MAQSKSTKLDEILEQYWKQRHGMYNANQDDVEMANNEAKTAITKLFLSQVPELDKLIDDLWGRALDMTSPDFANDKDYQTAQTNYKKHCLKELQALIESKVLEGRRDEWDLIEARREVSDNIMYGFMQERLAELEAPKEEKTDG